MTPHAAYERSDDFNGRELKRIWQWNHNPDDKLMKFPAVGRVGIPALVVVKVTGKTKPYTAVAKLDRYVDGVIVDLFETGRAGVDNYRGA